MGRLTAKQVQSLMADGYYGDGDGLALSVKHGRRYWAYRFMLDGRTRTMTFGSADRVSLSEARARAAVARGRVKAGIDPLAEKARAKAERARSRPAVSFSEATAAYIQAHKAAWRPRGERHWRQSLALHVLPRLCAKPVGGVTVDDVLRVLSPIWVNKNPMAVIVRSRIELVLDYAKARGWRSGENPALWRGNLRMLLAKPSKVHRIEHRPALAWQEAPALFAALREAHGMAARALRFLILTAARSGEARGCRWSEINLDEALWIIPASRMKSGREHRVPLSEPVCGILRELDAVRTGDLVFFGYVRGRPVSDVTVNALLHRLLPQTAATVHGMRSTFRDWCADTGKPGDLAEAALAHTVGSQVERAYRRSDVLEARRGLMQAWADYLIRPAADVVPLRRVRA